jgi:hypothetical protein
MIAMPEIPNNNIRSIPSDLSSLIFYLPLKFLLLDRTYEKFFR